MRLYRARARELNTRQGRRSSAVRSRLAALDAPFRKRRRELLFWQALYRLRKHPELQRTLRAIRRYRVRQKMRSGCKTFFDCRVERVVRVDVAPLALYLERSPVRDAVGRALVGLDRAGPDLPRDRRDGA